MPVNRQTFELVITQHRAKMTSTAYRIVHNSEEAEDVVQEALLSAWRGLPQFKEKAALLTWVTTIVRNKALDSLRRRATRLPAGVNGDAVLRRTASPEPSPDRECQARHDLAVVVAKRSEQEQELLLHEPFSKTPLTRPERRARYGLRQELLNNFSAEDFI